MRALHLGDKEGEKGGVKISLFKSKRGQLNLVKEKKKARITLCTFQNSSR